MRIGVDTGGTFTDVVVEDGGAIRCFKVLSTPADPSAAVLEALDRLRGSETEGARFVVHGSTVATNALLEGRTARAALLTTEGFEDVLEIGRQARPSLYDLEARGHPPLVPRDLRFGVPERVLASGDVRTPLHRDAVLAAAAAAARAGAESIAVCFLHSYLRPDHEREAGRLLRTSFSGPVTLSSEIVAEYREYERCSTATVNAAVSPIVGAYVSRLERSIGSRSLRIMGSNGGAISAARASAEAVRTVLSGPAAGVVGAHRLAAAGGLSRIISLDMGGTSTDVSLVPGEIVATGETTLAGHPIRIPVIDIHSVGAGGGSIAWLDAGGALKVGPRSAGADPGPACYGRGGPATVTDANLVLGRIVAERFLDGRMKLDEAAAGRAVGALASAAGLGFEETAAGILDVANVTMARAIRHVSLFRGHDPADFVLCAFGGAGGLHAADLAAAAGIPEAMIPPGPGVLSAWGLVASDVVVSRSATLLVPAASLSGGALERAFAPLVAAAMDDLEGEKAALAGGGPEAVERIVEARYRGQSHEVPVPAGGDWVDAFHEAHRRRYGFERRDEAVIAVTLRAVVRLPVVRPPSPTSGAADPGGAPSLRKVWDAGAWREARIVERSSLRVGDAVEGPAVIAEPGATTYVPGGARASAAADGSLRLVRIP